MKARLEDIVGKENVVDDPEILKAYSQDQSLVEPKMPQVVAFAEEVQQVQEVVKLANQEKVPIVPFSSGLNFHGATVPEHGGIILNMSKMDKIVEVDEKDWWVLIEPGVTYGRLQDELAPLGLRAMIPWGVHPNRSVLSSQMERDPNLSYATFEYGAERMLDIELILPEGDLYRTGGWSVAEKPQGSFNLQHRFWTGAQGTLGIVSRMGLKLEYLPEEGRVFFLGFDTCDEALPPLKMIQRKEIGWECFLLNRFNLAAAITNDWKVPEAFPAKAVESKEFAQLQQNLPAWTMIVSLPGAQYFPEDKFAYEEEALRKIAADCSVEVLTSIPGTKDLEAFFAKEVIRPWSVLKKFNYKGSVHDISFKAPLKKIPTFIGIIESMAKKHDYPLEEIGGYILPIERGRASHVEFDFHCAADAKEKAAIKKVWLETSQALMNEGAFFDRPYGAWAEMVYSRAGNYTEKLKELKKALDPNNIMNPGKLCFS
jgi:FAD/FMN-containing dehydrogenase